MLPRRPNDNFRLFFGMCKAHPLTDDNLTLTVVMICICKKSRLEMNLKERTKLHKKVTRPGN